MVQPNKRESLANKFTLPELEEALSNYRPKKNILGSKNGMFKNGEGEKYIRIRINGEKIRLSHIIWRLKTKELIPIGYNIHHKDENKRNNDFSNLELQEAINHGNLNLLKGR